MSSIKEYKCINCKAGLEFDPPSQRWKCKYCFSDFTKVDLDAFYKEDSSHDEDIPELESYVCKSCGAELITNGTIYATTCLFCKSPTIIKAGFSGKFKPKYLIPFKFTKQQAIDMYKKRVGKRLFIPDEFKQKEKIDDISGLYAPYWLFDSTTKAVIEGEGVKVSHWNQGEYRYTQKKYFSVIREGNIEYNRVPVDASKKLDDNLMQKIEPYDYTCLTDFSMKYMSGFLAERYDVDDKEAEPIMKNRVEKYTEDRIRSTISGYSTFSMTNKKIDFLNVSRDYCLLPVYVLINKYKGKEYIFMINGQTGKTVGNTPVAFSKQLRFALTLFAILWFFAVFGGALFV